MKKVLEGMKSIIAQMTKNENLPDTAVPNLSLFRSDRPTQLVSNIYVPSICLIVQGAKRVMLGEETLIYNKERFLLTAIDLPTIVQISEASPEKPYLGLKLKLDQRELAHLMIDSHLPPPKPQHSSCAMATGEVTQPLIEAFNRLLNLLNRPDDIPILSPLIQREICYLLLIGDQGMRLRQMASAGSQSQQVSRAIQWLRQNFKEQLRVEELAGMASMSKSSFHQHFREITAMSPLQYQKNLRLNEARRLMLLEHLDASSAAFQVGYESPSQFSREYSRLFGAPPSRDVSGLRQITADA